MQIRVFADERAVARELATIIVATVRDVPRAVLGLPTGRTPVLLYKELVALAARRRARFVARYDVQPGRVPGASRHAPGKLPPFHGAPPVRSPGRAPARACTFWTGTPTIPTPSVPVTKRPLWRPAESICRSWGWARTGTSASTSPRRRSRRAHTGSSCGPRHVAPMRACSAATPRRCRARRCRWAWPRFSRRGGSCCWRPAHSKAGCVRKMIEGPLTTLLPASFLQLHSRVEVMLDAAAGRDLDVR